jgi:hypothetical protein
VWVLDTEAKGTGADVVPLESVLRTPPVKPESLVVPAKPRPRPAAPAPEPKQPRTFKIDDVMTRRFLAENTNTAATIDALKPIRSIVDVNIYVWHPEADKWRLLTLAEQRAIWKLRSR